MKTYLRHKSLNVIDIKELIALEYLDFEGKYKDYVEKHDFWEICYVEKGSISVLVDDKRKTLGENTITFIPPYKTHSYFSPNGNDSSAFVMCFACSSQALKTLGGMDFSPDGNQLECLKKIMCEYKQTFSVNDEGAMEALPSPAFGGQQAIIVLLEYLLICFLRMLSLEKNPEVVFLQDDRFYAGLVDGIIDFFRENIGRKITLKEVCKRVNYSSSFICKTFKEQTGETLFSYFNRMKIDESKRMLLETEMSVAAISGELGFSEAKYFGSMFKKREGVSPVQYRKNNKK